MQKDIELYPTPIEGILNEKGLVLIKRVTRQNEELIWNETVGKYHYLGYDKTIGQRMKYMVLYESKLIACISFNRASLRVKVRDSYIGWDEAQKLENLHRIVNNNRFLILPWIKIKNLASYILGRTLKHLKKDWEQQYGTKLLMVETFVDAEKYKGTCYIAANWKHLGETKGFGKVGNAFVYHGRRKGVYIFPLQNEEIRHIQADSYLRTLKTEKRGLPDMMLQKPDWNPNILEEAGINEEMVKNLGNEISDFVAMFRPCINYSGLEVYMEAFLKGFMSDLPYKSAEPIALRYEISVRGTQRFLSSAKWDTSQAEEIYRINLANAIVSDTQGMITIDECGEPKKGKHSVGVSRQYLGSLGKTDNGQVAVYIGYTGSGGYGLIDRKLFIPEKWFDNDYADLRKKCGISDEIGFQTKPEIAAELLKKVTSTGLFPARWVGVDCLYGSNKAFLASIPDNLWYFADIRSDMLVFTEQPQMLIPEYPGRGRRDLKAKPSISPVNVSQIASEPNIRWNKVILGEGAKGPIIAEEHCVRVVMCDDNAPGAVVWLYIRKLEDGTIKFAISNAPWDISLFDLREAALMRWPIEQNFLECKNELGLDHCEARSLLAWNRHTLLVLLAHLLLTTLRLKYKKNSRRF